MLGGFGTDTGGRGVAGLAAGGRTGRAAGPFVCGRAIGGATEPGLGTTGLALGRAPGLPFGGITGFGRARSAFGGGSLGNPFLGSIRG